MRNLLAMPNAKEILRNEEGVANTKDIKTDDGWVNYPIWLQQQRDHQRQKEHETTPRQVTTNSSDQRSENAEQDEAEGLGEERYRVYQRQTDNGTNSIIGQFVDVQTLLATHLGIDRFRARARAEATAEPGETTTGECNLLCPGNRACARPSGHSSDQPCTCADPLCGW